MDKPCKHCGKSIQKHIGAFEPECNGTCEQFNDYCDCVSKDLDDLLNRGFEILKRHGVNK